jgi:hypothetical protein
MNSAGPFKARTNGFHEKSVAAATVESGVAAAPHYSPDDPFPALKGWAKFIRPLRGRLRNRGLRKIRDTCAHGLKTLKQPIEDPKTRLKPVFGSSVCHKSLM